MLSLPHCKAASELLMSESCCIMRRAVFEIAKQKDFSSSACIFVLTLMSNNTQHAHVCAAALPCGSLRCTAGTLPDTAS